MQVLLNLFLVLSLSFNLMIQTASASPLSPKFFDAPIDLDAPQEEPVKTFQDYWKDVGLKMDELRRVLSIENCYQSSLKFIGCYSAVETALSIGNPSYSEIYKDKKPYRVLFLESRLSEAKVKYSDVKGMSGIRILEVDPKKQTQTTSQTDEKKGRAQVKAENKADQAANNAALEVLFTKTKDQKIDFIALANWINEKYLTADTESFATGMAINSYLHVVKDPHSQLDPKAYMQNMQKAGANVKNYFGIGCPLGTVNGKVVFGSPFRGSPALTAGLRANDTLIAIDGQLIADNSEIDEVIKKIKGPQDTVVKLKVMRNKQEVELSITRGPIVTGHNVESYIVEDSGKKFGYMSLDNFMDFNTCDEIQKSVNKLTAEGAQGLIFDLRGNGGGSLYFASCISSIFVGPNKTVVYQKSLIPGFIRDQVEKTQSKFLFEDQDPKTGKIIRLPVTIKQTQLPVVTLVDRGSASASEIVSGVLQYYQRSLIMGERSFGKATVQRIFEYDKVNMGFPVQYDPLSNHQLGLPEEKTSYSGYPVSPSDVGKRNIRNEAYSKLLYRMTVQRFYMPSDTPNVPGFTNQIVGITPDIEVFYTPKATADDKVASREEDEYMSLPPAGTQNDKIYPGRDEIKKCMASSGNAEKLYNDRQNDAILPDYQVLAAQDALSCMTQ